MTLKELSREYRAQADALRQRILYLREWREAYARDESERRLLDERICTLTIMWRETRDLAVLTERYYERGYRRNAKYTI